MGETQANGACGYSEGGTWVFGFAWGNGSLGVHTCHPHASGAAGHDETRDIVLAATAAQQDPEPPVMAHLGASDPALLQWFQAQPAVARAEILNCYRHVPAAGSYS